MSINSHLGKTVPALAAITTVYTCSTGSHLAGAAINGDVIDLRGINTHHLNYGERYYAAIPHVTAFTTGGTTSAARKTTITVKLQHGDSSGAGDMDDLPKYGALTTSYGGSLSYWSSAMSTDHEIWSTGDSIYVSGPSVSYNLMACKRYIRAVGTVTPIVPTSTGANDMLFYTHMGITFMDPYSSPPAASTTSTSTST